MDYRKMANLRTNYRPELGLPILHAPLLPAIPRKKYRLSPFDALLVAVSLLLEWLLPILVQVLVAGPLHHPPLLTSQNMTSTTKSWVDQ